MKRPENDSVLGLDRSVAIRKIVGQGNRFSIHGFFFQKPMDPNPKRVDF